MEAPSRINNAIYNTLGERWYTAYDDPIALLRAENKIKTSWILKHIQQMNLIDPLILDVGCGAGFLCNELSEKGFKVKGIDLSFESLEIAQAYDQTGRVEYIQGDAYALNIPSSSVDIVTCLDFLEHVDRPQDVINEISRVLRPGGLFFFHTFNRNFISWLVIIKAVEILVKNTPKDMHVLELFIKPGELIKYAKAAGIEVSEMTGLKPKFSTIPLSALFSRVVPMSLEFELTSSLLLSYLGMGIKSELS